MTPESEDNFQFRVTDLKSLPLPGKSVFLKYLAISGFCTGFVALLAHSPGGAELRYRIETSLNVSLRHKLHLDPELSPQIRIFGFSDQDASILKRTMLLEKEWAALLRKIDSRNPRLIFIDKVFGYSGSKESPNPQYLEEIASVRAPVIIGGFFSPGKIVHRQALPVKNYFKKRETGSSGQILFGEQNFEAQLKRSDFKFYYGSAAQYREVFPNHSYINYNGSMNITPFHTTKDGITLPHAAILTANTITTDGAKIFVNGRRLYTTKKNDIFINTINPADFYKSIKNITSIEVTYGDIQAGDTVVILPEMFTGGTDFHNVPVGYLPGGFLMTSIINSVQTGEWLKTVPFEGFSYSLFGLLGMSIGALFPPVLFWTVVSCISLAIIATGVGGFSLASLILPWLWCILAFSLSSLTVFAYRSIYTEKIARLVNVVRQQKEEIRKRAEVLSSKTEDLNFILSNVDQGIFSVTRENSIHPEYSQHLEVIFKNQNPCTERPANFLLGNDPKQKISREKLDQLITLIISGGQQEWQNHREKLPERIHRNIDGRNLILQTDWRAFFSGGSEHLEKLTVIVSDITHIHAEKMRMVEKVKWKALTEMSNGIAHEVNNPLAIIEGMSAHLNYHIGQDRPDQNKVGHLVDRIRNAVARIKNIVDQMRSFSNDIKNDLLGVYSLKEIVHELQEFCRNDLSSEGIALETGEIHPSLQILCQKSVLIQVFIILINNARAALKGQDVKVIRMEFETREESVIIRLSDNGPGIPGQVKEKIFNPFFTGKPVGEGCGLGLFTARRAVESLGGTLKHLEDEDMTTFELDLPAGEAS